MTLTVSQLTVYPANRSDVPILSDISIVCAPGTLTLVVGQTGSGKSTLLHSIAGLIPLHSGTVQYGSESLWKGKHVNDAVKFKSGLLFQYPERQLFAESIRKEFAYSLRPLRLTKQEQQARIREVMHEMRLPERLLDSSFFALSDGQKRKVATATTLAVKPDWLLLDEPTAGIDPRSIPLLLTMLESRKGGSDGGVIVVSHDLDTFLPIADRVLVLAKGKLAADVSPEQLCANPDILLQANVGLPSAVKLAQELREHEVFLQSACVSPQAAADEIIRQIQASTMTVGIATATADVSAGNTAHLAKTSAVTVTAASAAHCAHYAASGGAASTTAHTATCTPLDGTGAGAAASAGTATAAGTANAVDTGTAREIGAARSVPDGEAPALPQSAGTTLANAAGSSAQRLHPITKWLLYMMLSAGILLQHSWAGVGAAAVITLVCLILSRESVHTILKPGKPLLIFIAISACISGVTLSFQPDSLIPRAFEFSLVAAAQTVQKLSEILLIMILGVLFAATTGPQVMQRGLEQAFSVLERFKLPVSIFTFATALLLKFIPMFFHEMEKMSLITRARGKSYVKAGSIRMRDMPVFMIPLILSMMKHAEDLAFALEARGYKLKRLIGDSSGKIVLQPLDKYCLAVGTALLGALIAIGSVA
ncbi:ATP-binding cassette domain-containing protein [Paenibacillus xerothermodurans]|uniref:ATP-binding cassette domain-containing protein n=1 Tax=Paenibacillus xerothermodurans TaxID=1977292 RepID=A0A2W1NDS1_PAEXE|nr:ATP-binding cassette domain-containing protein [Paenibacillus xerothermodurans]PZE22114.1 ATP-binding cassette domain-containing protein [Paenibacillus xerothermodurans]